MKPIKLSAVKNSEYNSIDLSNGADKTVIVDYEVLKKLVASLPEAPYSNFKESIERVLAGNSYTSSAIEKIKEKINIYEFTIAVQRVNAQSFNEPEEDELDTQPSKNRAKLS